MKKKLLSILLTVAMAATLLAGCGNSNEAADADKGNDAGTEQETQEPADTDAGQDAEEPAEGAGTESAEGKSVGFTVPSVGNDFMLALTEAVKAALEEQGVTCQVDSADGDVTTQIEQIENYITMGVDLIVAFPINGESLTSVCQKAIGEDIPVFAFAMEIPDGATTSMLSAEEADMGAACAEMTSEWIDQNFPDAGDGEVKVYMMTSSYSPEAVERCDAMKKIAENSKVELITEEVQDWNSADDARSRVENAFLVNEDIDVIMTCNGTTSLGVESYIASSDCPVEDISKFAIFTVDETQEIVAKIQASANNESALRGTISMGAISDTVNDFMSGAMPILTGEEPIAVINGAAKMITAETLAE